jgi:hypothetical protein
VVRTEPATVIVKALQIQKETRASAEELRKLLVPEILSPAAWPGWWKEAKEALAADPRIDHRKAYANLWSLASASEEAESQLPSWSPDAEPLENLALLATFLEQHPARREALLEAQRSQLEDLATGRRVGPEEAAAAGLWLLRFDPTATVRPEDHARRDSTNRLSRVEQEALFPTHDSRPLPLLNSDWWEAPGRASVCALRT